MRYLKKRSIQLTLSVCVLITFYSCNLEKRATNSINSLSDTNPEVSILNWRIIGPFNDSISTDKLFEDTDVELKRNNSFPIFDDLAALQGISDTAADGTVHYRKLIDTLVSQELGYFIDLEELFSTPKKGFAYAVCDIISKEDTVVAFLMGADDAIKVWVNGKLYIKDHLVSPYEKNGIIEKIPLKSGSNQVLFEIANIKEKWWGFNLQVSTIEHVRENALSGNYYNSSDNYTLAIGDSLHLKVSNPSFIPIEKNSTVKIYGVDGKLILQEEVSLKSDQKISLERLQEGAYKYKLYTDIDTLDGFFTYGDINKIYAANDLNEKVTFDEELFNTHSFLSKRVEHLLKLAKKSTGWKLSKGIAFCLYRLAEINHRYSLGESIYGSGLQMRTFKSSIDNSDEYYQVYIPEKYDQKLPLVVMIPYVTKVRPFYWGAVVANIERTEYIGKFAERYGFAVIWPSAKIYARYNLAPIVSETLNEVLEDVSKHYSIDNERTYLYGDCSGALQALLMATRHPDKFAAIGIEGSELISVDLGKEGNNIPYPRMNNNIFNLTDNLSNVPIFMLHSKNDTKAPLELANKFIDSVKTNGGRVILDDLNDAYKAALEKNIKLFSEQEVMNRIFKFFNNKKQIPPLKGFNYSTYGYYHGNVYGINVLEKFEAGKKAMVRMQPLEGNTLKFNTVNVKKMSIDLGELKGIDKNKKINVFFNRKLCFADKLADKAMPLKLTMVPLNDQKSIKQSDQSIYSGPINKLFLKKFAVVKPMVSDSFTNNAIQQLSAIWKSEYMVNIPLIDDSLVSSALKDGINLIFFADTSKASVPISTVNLADNIEYNDSFINFNGKKISGKELSFVRISEHPKTNNHILYIGSNYKGISENMLRDIIQQGWHDFEVWDTEQIIYRGNYE